MSLKNNNYTVYMHKNKINNKVYIGITGRQPQQRWGVNGCFYQPSSGRQSHFYNAIKKYGWNNFQHIILFTDLTKEQAELIEMKLIAKYHSVDKQYGYNMTNGGSTTGTLTDEIRAKISKANKGRPNKYKGVQRTEQTKQKISKARAEHRTVFEYNRNTGQFLKSFPSLIDAQKGSGVLRSNIVAICHKRVKASRDFIFRYQDEGYLYGQPLSENQMMICKNTHFRPVKQYDLDGNFIQEFPSIRDAQVFFGKKQGNTQIWHCANHLNSIALGYRWSYSDEELAILPNASRKNTRQVLRYNQSNDLIARYKNVKQAANSIGVKDWTLIKHLRDQNKLYKDSYWKYA